MLAGTNNYLILGVVSGVSFTFGNYVVSCFNLRLLRSILYIGLSLEEAEPLACRSMTNVDKKAVILF
mgnify:CR=1 FL=1